MDHPGWSPRGIDVNRPSVARVYDYLLGGAHNFLVDRELGDQFIGSSPEIVQSLRANRIFLRRGVRYLAEQGIRQFLDIGSGIPTVGNVHEVAREVAPDASVVYVDVDPVAVAHGKSILGGDPRAAVIHADLREPEEIQQTVRRLGLIDFSRPVGVLCVAVLPFIPDSDDPAGLVNRLCAPLASGSYLLLSHATTDEQPPRLTEALQLFERTPMPIEARTHKEVLAFFDQLRLVEPGLVFLPAWRPDHGDPLDCPQQIAFYAGVGRKD